MVYFRSCFSQEHHRRINEKIIQPTTREQQAQEKQDEEPPENSGKLLVDATCTPADIGYPTDLSLLNEARGKTEHIIDRFHEHLVEKTEKVRKKARTYRRKARRGLPRSSQAEKPGKETTQNHWQTTALPQRQSWAYQSHD